MDPKSEEKKTKIIAAAKVEFSKKGFGEANIREIGGAAGATLGWVYQLFKSKEGLFIALTEPAVTAFESCFGEQLFEGEFPQTLKTGIEAMMDAAFNDPDSIRLLSNAKDSPRQTFIQQLAEQCALSAQKHAENSSAVDIAHLAMLFRITFIALMEITVQGMTRADAKAFLPVLCSFLVAGWEKALQVN